MTNTKTDNKKMNLAILAVVMGNVIWGSDYLFTRVALNTVKPVVLLSLRYCIAFLTMNIWMLVSGEKLHLRGKHANMLPLLGLTESACVLCGNYGILYTNASFSGILMSLSPIFAILLAGLFLKEYPTRGQLIFSIVPIIGVIMMTVAGQSMGVVTAVGVIFLLGSCLCSGGFKTVNRRISTEFTAMERTYAMMLVCTVVFTTAAMVSVRGDLSAYLAPFHDWRLALSIIILGVLCSFLANAIVNYGAVYMSVTKLSAFGSINTLTGAVSGVIFLGEPMSALAILGGALVIIGVWQVNKLGK